MLAGFGRADEQICIQGASGESRVGDRVTYGNFIRMMSHTIKQAHGKGEYIFQQGDPVRFFYCLLEGEVEIVTPTGPDGSSKSYNRLLAGESFGENSLLRGSNQRVSSVRCTTPVEVLQLSKEDFEAVFGCGVPDEDSREAAGGGSRMGAKRRSSSYTKWLSVEDDALRSRLLGFLQMVSPSTRRTLKRGEAVFEEGSAVDSFYILEAGTLEVDGGLSYRQSIKPGDAQGKKQKPTKGAASRQRLGEIAAGEGFGESSLLLGKDVRTKTVSCATDKCEVRPATWHPASCPPNVVDAQVRFLTPFLRTENDECPL